MFKRRTLFIVGAGASREFSLPDGPMLAKIISEKTHTSRDDPFTTKLGDQAIYDAMRKCDPKRINEFLAACRSINDGAPMASSIDDFLDNHAKNDTIRTVGKIAITRAILEAERVSDLYVDPSNIYNSVDVTKIEASWLLKFVRMLGRNVAKESVDSIFKNIAFITFNYDRCIEHGLYYCLQRLFSLSRERAAEIVNGLTILHPYGKVGHPLRAPNVTFGGSVRGEDYLALSKEIKTYTEQVDDQDELQAIHREMTAAERIVFLGFAFHEQNLSLLKPPHPLNPIDVYGTAFGMADSDVEVVKHQLLTFFNDAMIQMQNRIKIENKLKCFQLFDQYSRTLPS